MVTNMMELAKTVVQRVPEAYEEQNSHQIALVDTTEILIPESRLELKIFLLKNQQF